MADYQRRQQFGLDQPHQRPGETASKGPSTQQILAVVTLLPLGGFLLLLTGLTLGGTLLGLAVSAPVFLIFSPVLVPATLTIALAVAGFMTSGAFGVTGLSSLSWLANFLRRMNLREVPEHAAEGMKRRVQDTAGYLGQKTREAGEAVQSKAQEGSKAQEAAKRT